MSLVPSSLLFLVTVLDGFDDEWAIRLDIYILQCTKLKIGCLICKYRFFSLKIHIQGKIQVIQSQPQWLAFFIFFENFSENSAKSGFVW